MLQIETLESIKRSASIPSMPLVATRCYEMTQDPNCDLNKLVELLSTDPGIAADVLRLSNSSLFGVTRQVGSLHQAMTLLGIKRVRQLVLTRYLVHKTQEMATDLIDFNYYWRRSLATAILSAKFAEVLSPGQRDEAFIGGLLADLGVIVMSRCMPEVYGQIVANYRPHGTEDWIHAEHNIMGVSHGEVSAMILEKWNLPVSVVEGVHYHHASHGDLPKDSAGAKLAKIIGAGSIIAKTLSETMDPDVALKACIEGMERVNLDVSVLAQALDGLDQQIEDMARLLQVEVLASRIFSVISKQLSETIGAGTAASVG
jgi:HD-like signal output (HDOD) protein